MLFCSSEEGIPTPSYSWEKLDALPKLPHNAMQGITNNLAVGVPFCPTFAGKSHTHSVAQTQQQSHHLSHLSCARPKLLPTWRPLPQPKPDPTPTDPAEGWWWMDGSDSNHVNIVNECQEWEDTWCFFLNDFPHSLMLNTKSDTFPRQIQTRSASVFKPSGGLTHIQLPLEWQERVYWSLVFSIRERCGLSFLSQLCSLHSQKHLHLCLYTTGQ